MSDQKIALVTGASKKVGQAIALKLLENGYELILHANNSIDDLTSWAKNHKSNLIREIIKADLSIESEQNKFINYVNQKTPFLNLLVNNASDFKRKRFTDINRTEYQKMLSVNLEAPFFLIQGLLPLFNNSSSVINIIDAMWQRPKKGFSHYAVSKAGLAILTRILAKELAPIRINAVAPGLMAFQPFFSETEKELLLKEIPAGHLGSFDDIAEAVLFLHEKAPYAMGEILVIDGGRSIA
jgi:pteridine reductase